MAKEDLHDIEEKYKNLSITYKGSKLKVKNIKDPYPFSTALSLDVIRQIIDISDIEKFISLIIEESNYPNTHFIIRKYNKKDNNDIFIYEEVDKIEKWIQGIPIIEDKTLYKNNILQLYIENTFANTNDFMLWIRNRNDITIKQEVNNNSLEKYCWYIEKILENKYDFNTNYAPNDIKNGLNDNYQTMKNFLDNVIRIRNQASSESELFSKIIEKYNSVFGFNISNATLGFLTRTESRKKLNSSSCNSYGARILIKALD